MIRSPIYRNALSAVLLVVALAGIVVQLRLVRQGLATSETRFVLIAYFLIAIYAGVSIALRLRAARPKS